MEKPDSGGRRVAFFGGSFDPPHLGHLAIARAARDALHLDEVLFAPVGAQPLKPGGSTASFDDRVAMTRLAVAGEACFMVSLVDAPMPASAPNYTFDTLVRLRAQLAADGQLFCLMGADSLLNFRHWHRAAEIPFVAALVVASRPGQSLDDLSSALPVGLSLQSESSAAQPVAGPVELHCGVLRNGAGETSPFYLLSGLDVDISATHVREWLHDGDSQRAVSGLERLPLPVAVSDYIAAHQLYR